jgi:hypothetical protein
MVPGGDNQRPAAAPDASQVAEALATAVKACAVWPRANPRVQQNGAALAELLRERIEYPDVLEVRVRGSELLVGRDCASPSPVTRWLIARFRDVGLAGLEISAGVDRDALIDFGTALARAGRQGARRNPEANPPSAGSPQSGDCTLDWPARHPTLRPLELVFEGEHSADADGAGAGTSVNDLLQRQLIEALQESTAIRSRLRSLHDMLAGEVRGVIAVDVLACVVEAMPIEIARDADLARAAVERVLAETHVGAMAQLRVGRPPDEQALTRMAADVARTWFASAEAGFAARDELPPGRSDDEAIVADADALRAELATLPEEGPGRLAAVADRARLDAEFSGVCLHVLMQPRRAESTGALLQTLQSLLADADPARLRILDAYLMPQPGGQPPRAGDAAAQTIVQFLERCGHGKLVRARRYLDAAFVARTFPGSLPLCARVLGASEAGREVLRAGLARHALPELVAGAEHLAASGALTDGALLTTLRELGGDLALPFVSRAAAAGAADAREAVVACLRGLPLPDAEGAALRCVRPASALPTPYLAGLCRLLETGARRDTDVQQQSARLLRDFVAASATQPLDVRLRAIRSLALVPTGETRTLLRRLLRRSWFSFGATARAVRIEVRTVLAALGAKERR